MHKINFKVVWVELESESTRRRQIINNNTRIKMAVQDGVRKMMLILRFIFKMVIKAKQTLGEEVGV